MSAYEGSAMQAAQEAVAAQPKQATESLQLRLKRFEDAVLKREQTTVAKVRAGAALEAAQLAYNAALDAESAAKDAVFAAREALRPETHPTAEVGR